MDETRWDLLISELLKFAEAQNLNYRPARICVTDEALASQMSEQLAGSGTTLTWDPAPGFWTTVKADMAEHLADAASAPALAESG